MFGLSFGSKTSKEAKEDKSSAVSKKEKSKEKENVYIFEVWTDHEIMPKKKDIIKEYCVKIHHIPHKFGEWLVVTHEMHHMSKNENFNGFKKVVRKKYKLCRFEHMNKIDVTKIDKNSVWIRLLDDLIDYGYVTFVK